MSQDDDPTLARKALRTVTPEYFGREDREMDAIGWGLFLGLVVLLVPLLPFIVIVWAVSKVAEWVARRGARE
ncbi:DUF7535 family protein [Halomarina litorea]|uniref:DUF7535 family protein n=1 Tax=Halomarina litorea TaxID=2961595 RepID=UPI0020C3D5C7|nr:hypothetical protein [Halomarina sp. BCD28]